jgi:hypothetical protein
MRDIKKTDRHSGEGRNPAPRVCAAKDSCARQTPRDWIPTFVGMTGRLRFILPLKNNQLNCKVICA